MQVDPSASMWRWSIGVEIGGREFDIPALAARDWWPVLAAGDPGRVLELIDAPDLDDHLIEITLTEADGRAMIEAIEQAAGRSLHVAYVLVAVAESQWPVINGRMMLRGFRWDTAPLGAALDVIYTIVIEGLDEEARKKFLDMLENDALTTGRKRTVDRERVLDEFEAMAGPRPTGARSSAGPSGSGPPRTRQRRPQRRPDGPSPAPTAPPG